MPKKGKYALADGSSGGGDKKTSDDLSPESSSSTLEEITMGKQIDPKDVPFWCSSRFALAVIGFFGTINLYALRINLSVAMVCMVNQTALLESNPMDVAFANYTNATHSFNLTVKESPAVDKCPRQASSNSNDTNQMEGDFLWDKEKQGIILGSFFWGYLITQLPGGILASRFGAKRVIGFFMIATSIATLLVPVGARTNYIFLIVLRIICGMGSGIWFPCFHIMWANWAPPLERSKLMSFTYSGAQLGNVLTLPLAGLLCKYGFDGGWPSIFYILGALSLIWCILWLALVSDCPTAHRRISKIEKAYIVQSLRGEMKSHHSKKLDIPFKSLFLSMPVWAIIVANITSDWGVYTFLTNIPSYMNEVLKFEITANGFLSSIPYLLFWFIATMSGVVADSLRSKKLLNTTQTRKLFNSLGLLLPAVMVLVLGFLDCTQAYLAVALLAIGVSMNGFAFSGFVVNPVDISPKHSGIIFGISNSLAAVTGFLAPYIVGVITSDQTRQQWQVVFYICAAVNTFGALFFIFGSSGNIQPWARETEPDERSVELQDLTIDKNSAPVNGESVNHDDRKQPMI
ncbi:sialin-like [Tubulanus polymorphus]|uniref:sialin-like n=1 Tax=Tubulanus polymorphus TaxID=672921 RepID=UPI003DA37B10